MSNIPQFSFDAPINRVWKSDDGRMFFEGVASTTSVDTQKERTSDNCIKSMAAQTGLDLFPEHKRIAGTELGATVEHEVNAGALVVKGELFDDNPQAVRIYNRMAAGKSYGLSIGGKVKAAHWELAKTGERIRVLDDIDLNHIAITDNPANTDTWTAIIAKSADGVEEFDMTTEAAKEMGEETTEPVQVEVVAVSDEQPLPPVAFAENIAKPSAEERFDEVYERLYPLLDALRETVRGVCGAEAEQRLPLFVAALGDFQVAATEAVSEEIAKAGARHTAAEVQTIHSAIASLQKVCGCDTCAGAVAKTGAQESEAELMPDEVAKAEETDVASDAPAEEVVEKTEETAEPVAEEPTAEATETVAKAETEGADEVAKTETPDIDAIVAKAVADAIKPLQDELATLKAQPAEGGPVSKVSGDEETSGLVPAADEVAKAMGDAAEAHDSRSYHRLMAAKIFAGQ